MHQILFQLGALVTTALPLPADDLRLAQVEATQPAVVAAPPPEAAEISAEGTESLSSFRAGDLIAAATNLAALPEGLSAGAAKHAQGVIAYYRGDRSAAARLFNEAAGLDASYAPPVAALIRLRLAEGDTSGARALFEQRLSAS
jgi:hypothetical protein